MPLDEWVNALCTRCGHRAARHAGFVGPCEDCLEELEVICERFLGGNK